MRLNRLTSRSVRVRPFGTLGFGGSCRLRTAGNRLSPRALGDRAPSSTAAGEALVDLDLEADGAEPQGLVKASQPLVAPVEDEQGASEWEDWLQLFAASDAAAERAEELKQQLSDAVTMEAYTTAAGIKQELQELEAKNVAATVQKQLEAALAVEDYEAAARCCSEGLTALQGWWAGTGEGDAVGHLLHVAPEYGRYTGRAYTARDLAELAGWRDGASPMQRLRISRPPTSGNSSAGGGGTFSAPTPASVNRPPRPAGSPASPSSRLPSITPGSSVRKSGPLGSPAMEVFLARGGPKSSSSSSPVAGSAPLVHQAVALLPGNLAKQANARRSSSSATRARPAAGKSALAASETRPGRERGEGQGSRTVASQGARLSSLLGLGPMARLTISILRDGSASIKAIPPARNLPTSTDTTAAAAPSTSSTSTAAAAGSSSSSRQSLPTAEQLRTRFNTSWEADEAAATLRALAGDDPAPSEHASSSSLENQVQQQGEASQLAQAQAQSSQLQGQKGASGIVVEIEVTDLAGDMVVDVSAGAGAVDIDASHSGDEEDQEVAEAELQGLQKSSKVDESGNEEEVGQEWAAAAAELVSSLEGQLASGVSITSAELASLASIVQGLSAAGSDSQSVEGNDGSAEEEEEGAGSQPTELHRVPASLVWRGRDAFNLCVQPPPGSQPQAPGPSRANRRRARSQDGGRGGSARGTAARGAEAGLADVAVQFEVLIPVSQLGQGERTAAAVARVAERVAAAQAQQVGHAVPQAGLRQALASLSLALAAGQSQDLLIPSAARLALSDDAQLTSPSTSPQPSSSPASDLEQQQPQGSAPLPTDPASSSHPSSTPSSATPRSASSSSSSSSTATATRKAASSAAAVADAELAASGSSLVRYSRVALGDRNSRTDPFSGLFLGSFGPHGPELLQLQRGVWDGEEAVLATKLTGDVNVPAGVMSFRAKVGRKHKLSARDVYPEELGAIARYKGEGKVAQKGYSQPAWVDGELLVFGPGGSQLTGGAELGFVWIVPGERRYLILLSKLDLSSTAFSQ
ncbi:hypothetical protein QJQ45_011236 [Haematococcus lacustris]|nr:hypothetical protein QJQ45_011236 [Haematococcus lacustris]